MTQRNTGKEIVVPGAESVNLSHNSSIDSDKEKQILFFVFILLFKFPMYC